MTFATYQELVDDVQKVLARTSVEFVGMMPSFMVMAEARIYGGFGSPGDPLYSPPLRVREMETTADSAITAGVGGLPGDFLACRAVRRDGDTYGLDFLPPAQFWPLSNVLTTGDANTFTIEGSNIYLIPQAFTGTLKILYHREFAPLSPSIQSHDLLTNHGPIFAAAMRSEGASFIRNDSVMSLEAQRCASLIKAANRISHAQRYPGRMQMGMRPIG